MKSQGSPHIDYIRVFIDGRKWPNQRLVTRRKLPANRTQKLGNVVQ